MTLTDEIDVSRGDLLVGVDQAPSRAHEVDAMLVWMSAEDLEPGRQYLLQSANCTSSASVASIRHRIDVDTLEEQQAVSLGLNDIGRCAVTSDRELLFDSYWRRTVRRVRLCSLTACRTPRSPPG